MKTRILIVDDEMEFVKTIAERLRARGYFVEGASDGKQALDMVSEYNYDVVILDVQMPKMGGIETLRAIKEKKPLIEVLMLTGHGTIENAIEGMKMGAFDFLLKPCPMDVLLEKIEAARKRKLDQEERIRRAFADRVATSPLSVLESKDK